MLRQRPKRRTNPQVFADNLISHVGLAVVDFEAALKRYQLLTGDGHPRIAEVPDQQVKVAIFSPDRGATEEAGGRIELVSPTSENSPVAKFLAKRGEGLHHLCLYVDNLDEKLAELKKAGVRLIDETPRVGAEGNKIAFLHPAGTCGVLIELEERPR